MTGQQTDVWRQLIDLAEQPRSGADAPTAGSPRTTLASANGREGGGSGRLRQSSGPWTSAATVADDLRSSMRAAKDKLVTSHEGVASEGSGLSSIAALGAVRDSWEQRLEDARKECESLAGKLRKVAKDHEENEAATTSSFEQRGK